MMWTAWITGSIAFDNRPLLSPRSCCVNVREGDLSWFVEFRTIEPEISGYMYKFGRPGETHCDDAADYRAALIPFISLPKANRPYVFCAIPHDSALNPGQTFEVLLP